MRVDGKRQFRPGSWHPSCLIKCLNDRRNSVSNFIREFHYFAKNLTEKHFVLTTKRFAEDKVK